MKLENIRNLRITAEQVNAWLKNGGEWPERFNKQEDWAIIHDTAGDLWMIDAASQDLSNLAEPIITTCSKEWLEIIQQPTTFEHALECMRKRPIVFQDSTLEELYRMKDGGLEELKVIDVLEGVAIKEFKPMEFDGLIDGFISDTFTMRPNIDWETGMEFRDIREGN